MGKCKKPGMAKAMKEASKPLGYAKAGKPPVGSSKK